MSVATELPSRSRLGSETRGVLKSAGNRARVSEEPNRKKEVPNKPSRIITEMPASVVRSNSSVDSTCSSESFSGGGSSVKLASSKRRVKTSNGSKCEKVAPDGILSPVVPGPLKRCDWITPNSDTLYTSFHDEEWGVPVHDDKKLFELLVLSIALAEFTWTTILNKRNIFRKFFDNYNPSSIAKFTEEEMALMRSNGSTLLSEAKLRAIVENANQTLKIQQEFGSFSNFLWGFVNHKPIRNRFRYGRQVPVKTPKAEQISKDLMQRGFRCVGPSVVYSFMQVAGLVNDHLITCFRYPECNKNVTKDTKPNNEDMELPTNTLENSKGHLV